MDEKTRELVEAAEARANAATDGPWRICAQKVGSFRGNSVSVDADPGEPGSWITSIRMGHSYDEIVIFANEPSVADATLMASARSDVPALCAIIREQAARLELLESATKVAAGETLVVVAKEGADIETRVLAKVSIKDEHHGPVVVLPHGWSTLPVDELRRALERTEPGSP